MHKLEILKKGGEKASRNNPKNYNRQKEIVVSKKIRLLGKHLSLEISYTSVGILENLKNLLKIGTSGDISTDRGSNLSRSTIQFLRNCPLLCTHFLFYYFIR